jgi:hypothetical protein
MTMFFSGDVHFRLVSCFSAPQVRELVLMALPSPSLAGRLVMATVMSVSQPTACLASGHRTANDLLERETQA